MKIADPGEALAGSELASLPSLEEIFTSIFKDRRRIALVTGGVLLLTFIACAVVRAKFEASSSLLVLLGPEYTVRPEAGAQTMATATLASDQIMKGEVEILKDDGLHETVIRKIGLARLYPEYLEPPGLLARVRRSVENAITSAQLALGLSARAQAEAEPVRQALPRFDNNLSVLATKDANVITVSFSHRDAQVAADVTNTLITVYQQHRHSIYLDAQSGLIADQVGRLRRTLREADTQLAEFKRSHDISNYDLQRDLLLHQRADLASALGDADSTLVQLRSRAETLTVQLASTPTDVRQYAERDPDTRIGTLLSALQDLREKQAEFATRLVPNSRILSVLQARIDQRSSELQALKSDRSASVVRLGHNTVWDSIELQRKQAAADITATEARQSALLKEIEHVSAEVTKLNADAITLAQLERERDLAEEHYRATAKLLDDRRITEAVDAQRAADVQAIDKAQPPLRPRSLRLLIGFAGGFLSLMAGGATALVSDYFRKGFISPDKLERALRLTVLATIPDYELVDCWEASRRSLITAAAKPTEALK